jgi:hypothetical protein
METPATLTLADEKTRLRYHNLALKAMYQRGPAIKLFCIECMGYSYQDAKACDNSRCPLWLVSNGSFKRPLPSLSAAEEPI